MSRVRDSIDRIAGRVDAVISAVDAEQDPQPALARLAALAEIEVASAGFAAVQDALDRTITADDDLLA